MNPQLQGLYVITDDRNEGVTTLTRRVDAALRGGARLVQYRNKQGAAQHRLATATALQALCQSHGVPLLINDDIQLAVAVGAAGVHLGRDDQPTAMARAQLPPGGLIGRSCYDRFDLAQRAADEQADYVAFGSFFASPTKPHAVTAPLPLLRRARRELALPVVAIGGITPENGAALVEAGASMLAVISAVFAAPDVTHAARAFAPCFKSAEETSS
jgi:thiamine-phosphate pyrophosphorylase